MTATARTPPLDAAEFGELYQRLRRAADWGPADRQGALNHLTQAELLAAVGEVRLGRTVSLEAPVESRVTADNPDPSVHEMTGPPGDQADPEGLSFAQDRLAINVHGNADSHIDALCHVMYRRALYNGVAADAVSATGASELSIEVAGNGIAGRGVLLDIPRLREVRWLEPGDHVTAEDLARAADAQRVRVGQGDLLFVRVGHRRRVRAPPLAEPDQASRHCRDKRRERDHHGHVQRREKYESPSEVDDGGKNAPNKCVC